MPGMAAGANKVRGETPSWAERNIPTPAWRRMKSGESAQFGALTNNKGRTKSHRRAMMEHYSHGR